MSFYWSKRKEAIISKLTGGIATSQELMHTYLFWPLGNAVPSPTQMIKAGFTCNADGIIGDRVQCNCCGVSFGHWRFDDDPLAVHLEESPDCENALECDRMAKGIWKFMGPSPQKAYQNQCHQEEKRPRSCVKTSDTGSINKSVKFAAYPGVNIIEKSTPAPSTAPSAPPAPPVTSASRQITSQIDEKPLCAFLAATPLRAAPPSPPLSPKSTPAEPEKHSLLLPTVLPPSPPLSHTPTPAPLAPSASVSPQKCAKNNKTRQQRPSRIPRPARTPTSPHCTSQKWEIITYAPAAAVSSPLSPHAAPFSPRITPEKHEMPPKRTYVPPHRRSYITIGELFKKFGSSWSRATPCSVQKQPFTMQRSNAPDLARSTPESTSQSERSNINCAKVNSAHGSALFISILLPRLRHPIQHGHQQKTPSYWPGSLFRQSSMASPHKSLEKTCEKCGHGVIQTLMDAVLQLLGEFRHAYYGPRIV